MARRSRNYAFGSKGPDDKTAHVFTKDIWQCRAAASPYVALSVGVVMATRSAVIRANSIFHTFVYLLLFASLAAFSLMIQVQYTALPSGNSSIHLRTSAGQMFHGLI